jgi:hypothetical protein
MNLDTIGAMLARIGGYLGKNFALDSRGMLTLSYAGDRVCVFAARDGFQPRIGMCTPLVSGATDALLLRAMTMNANLERETGVLALDDRGALVFTAARDAAGLTEEILADFISDFLRVAVELDEALISVERRQSAPEAIASMESMIWA